MCCGPWVFTDTSFEGDKATGDPNKKVDWVRVSELLSKADRERSLPRFLQVGAGSGSNLDF